MEFTNIIQLINHKTFIYITLYKDHQEPNISFL